MYVEKRDKSVRYGMSYRGSDGKYKKTSVTYPKDNAVNRREAEAILNNRIRKALLGSPRTDITLGELAEIYLAQNRAYIKEVTHKRNETSMKAIVSMVGADTNVRSMGSTKLVQAFCGSGRHNSTLNEFLRRFKAMMRWAYRNDYVEDVSWLDKVKPFPAPSTKEKNEFKYLERDELQELLPNLTVKIDRYAITMLLLSGLRVGEMLGLNRSDVDFDKRVIHVNKTYNEQLHRISDGAKTYSGNRDVYMQEELLELCREIDNDLGERDLFLTDENGNVLSYARLNKYFAENTERYLKRRMTLHSLRHSHASLLFEAGVSLKAVSERLGHANSRVTEDIYLHITKRKQEMYNAEMERVHLL